MKEHINKKQALYESIMRSVAKTVKHALNEDAFSEDLIISGGLGYIQANGTMQGYYERANIKRIVPTKKISSVATDGTNIYYNPDFVNELSDQEQAFLILHCCAEIQMSDLPESDHVAMLEDNIALDKKVNRFLENKWPDDFAGLTRKLNGYI